MKPTLVVLAAGASRRLGECKALVNLGGHSPLERLLAAGATCSDLAPRVVAGADAGPIRDHLDAARLPHPPELVLHDGWATGRLSSVQAAARACPGQDLCLAPVDVPLVGAATFARLVEVWLAEGAPGTGWLAPYLRERGAHERDGREAKTRRFGHPIVIGRALLEQLSDLAPDEPLRNLRARAHPLLSVEVDDAAILDDLDTPDDLRTLRERILSR